MEGRGEELISICTCTCIIDHLLGSICTLTKYSVNRLGFVIITHEWHGISEMCMHYCKLINLCTFLIFKSVANVM